MKIIDIHQDSIEKRLEAIEQQLNLILEKGSFSSSEITYLTLEGAADLLSKSIHTLYGMVSRREIPHIKKRNRLYFKEEELRSWLEQGKR